MRQFKTHLQNSIENNEILKLHFYLSLKCYLTLSAIQHTLSSEYNKKNILLAIKILNENK